jgi:glucuronokinase
VIDSARAFARAGLAGNPSDGYHGRVVAFPVRNFSARVTVWDSEVLEIVASPQHDPRRFDNLEDLAGRAQRLGYYGGVRLLLATCKRFWEFCREQEIALPQKNFTLSYTTDIPRQVGLAGSSAIIVAALKALMGFHSLDENDIPKPVLPNLALSVEREELLIAGGLQDRVCQVYDGLIYMDFGEEIMRRQGFGNYEPLEGVRLPAFALVISTDTRESGRILSDLRFRWERGDPETRQLLAEVAACADDARRALLAGDVKALGEVMTRNFELRRRLLGDSVIGAPTLRLVEIAREVGVAASLPGSSGSALCLLESEEIAAKLERRFREAGCEFVRVRT